jgi:hypothetical protein
VRKSAVPQSFDVLPCVLADGIAEAVACPPDPAARATAISSVVREIYESMLWLYGAEVQNEELASLQRVVAAAQDHQVRMTFLREPATVTGALTS